MLHASAADFTRLELERPALASRLLRNLLQRSADMVVRLSAEVAALEG